MLRDLLELFRVTSASETPCAVDLEAEVRQALDTLRPRIAHRGVRVTVSPLPRVWGQPEKLRHVLSNVLDNAVKYVRPGHRDVTLAGFQENGAVRLEVRDNGIGIPPAYQQRIFHLFGRVPAAQQEVDGQPAAGTGVGLALVKRIVEEHHGEVWVESSPGVGSCFYVRLPAPREDASETRRSKA
jgi:signal transduction histidine kinase